jgi:hypothetical protein
MGLLYSLFYIGIFFLDFGDEEFEETSLWRNSSLISAILKGYFDIE